MFDKIKEANKALLSVIVDDHDGDKAAEAQKNFNTVLEEAETAHQTALDEKAAEMQTKVDELSTETTELKDRVIELENDLKVANEANEGLREAVKETNEENESLKTKVGELEADVKAKEEANKKLADETGDKHAEVNADPNKKIVEGEKLSAEEHWKRAMDKAAQQN